MRLKHDKNNQCAVTSRFVNFINYCIFGFILHASILAMSLINKALRIYFAKRIKAIRQYSTQPVDIQKRMLNMLVQKGSKTWIGEKYDFGSIHSISDYQQRIPIQKYEDFAPAIERIRKGESNVLWPGETHWFAKSSGTTNDKSKFIPVTNAALQQCHYQGGIDSCALFLENNPNTEVFKGKTLTLGGSHQIDYFDKNSRSGDLSAIMLQNIPLWADFLRTPPRKIALLAQWEEKLEKLTQHAIKQNVTALAGVPSWNMVMIKHVLQVTGKKNLLEVWPNLELFLHGGVNFAPYRDQYQQLIPSTKMKYVETYNASEGFFGIQDDPQNQAMLLMLDYGVFYEFIPMEQLSSGNYKTYHLGEVQTGVNYAVVISTNSGLWRYLIGDTIMFTGTNPYKIVITGRTRHFINAFGEEVIIDNAERALSEACKITGAIILEYTAAPVYMNANKKGCHEWLIEFEKEPDNNEKFTEILDNTLMCLNSDYEAKRYKNITLDKPIIRIMPKGTFYKWFSIKGKLGGQNKMPRLSNDRKYVEELITLE